MSVNKSSVAQHGAECCRQMHLKAVWLHPEQRPPPASDAQQSQQRYVPELTQSHGQFSLQQFPPLPQCAVV